MRVVNPNNILYIYISIVGKPISLVVSDPKPEVICSITSSINYCYKQDVLFYVWVIFFWCKRVYVSPDGKRLPPPIYNCNTRGVTG